VDITVLEKIPTGTNVFPDIAAGVDDDNNPLFTGAVVYSFNAVNLGVLVWNGTKWQSFCDYYTLLPASAVPDGNLVAELRIKNENIESQK
jgi:hypothetical protein